MMTEIKDFPGYMINENGVVINKTGHVLKPAISNAGYLRTSLETYDGNGKLIHRYNKSIHRLVAETFIPNPNNLPVVMHIDNDPLHNHVSNLKWGTASDNIQQAYREGRMSAPRYKPENVYEVFNNSETIKCKGRKGVAELLGLTEKYIRPGIIKSGKYKGYIVKNTHIKVKPAVIFQ